MSFGDLLLKLAMVGAVISAGLFIPALRGRGNTTVGRTDSPSLRAATWVFVAHTTLLTAALALVWVLFLTHRFEYAYVAQFSSRALAPALTFAASWAGQEGSILLWAAIAAWLGIALLRQPGTLARPAMFFMSVLQVLLLILLMIRSPFVLSTTIPDDGQGLNPLLEDPWMVAHPPALFLGYAALLVPFALALAALVRQDYREWNRMVWPWTLFAVITLGTGIVLGGIWAYRVLGWGGYWGWDPVENASLIPWLVSIALLHGLLIQRTTGGLVRTNLALAGIAWVTVIGGTYLTRSGVLQDFSVHSFADSGLNPPLLLLLLVSLALPLAMLARRWTAIGSPGGRWASLSRESALWLGMVTVLLLAALVAFGTTAPVLTALVGKPAGVQPAFYTAVSLPVGVALVLLMALAPALRWSRQNGKTWLNPLMPGFALAVVALAVAWVAGMREPARVVLLVTVAIAFGVNAVWTVRLFRRGWLYGAGHLGHVGIAVMLLGMVISATLGRSERVSVAQGGTAQALGRDLTFAGEEVTARGEHILTVNVRSPKGTLELRPRVMHMPRGEGKLHKPALAEGGELYLAVIETQVQSASPVEPVWLSKGEELMRGEVGYTFAGFRIASHEEMEVFADIRVRRGVQAAVASPGIKVGPGGRQTLAALVPDLGEIVVAGMDADHARVAVRLPAGAAGSLAVMELSTKPFVNLVWIGAVIALLGSALAGLRRAVEHVPGHAARRQAAAHTARA